MALFDRGARRAPLIGKVVGIGQVDEISDHTWVVIDAVDGSCIMRISGGSNPPTYRSAERSWHTPATASRANDPGAGLQELSPGELEAGDL